MKPDPLPPSLRELEEMLARRPTPEPGSQMRDRVLAAMTIEQTRLVTDHASVRRGLKAYDFSFGWRVAAAVVLMVNVSLSAANGIRIQSISNAAANMPHPMPAIRAEPDDQFAPIAAMALAQLTPVPDASLICQRFLERGEH